MMPPWSAVRRLVLASALCLAVLLAAATPPVSHATPPVAAAGSHAALQGPQPFVTLFCQFPDILENIGLPLHYERLLGDVAPGLGDYWAEVSYGQISLAGSQVARWYVMPHPSNAYQLRHASQALLDRLAEDCTAAADTDVYFPDYVGINLVFNFCMEEAYGGILRLTRDGVEKSYGVTWLCLGKFGWQATVAHEMGHALGLRHSTDLVSGPYGDAWDLMSSCDSCRRQPPFGAVAQHPIAYRKDRLGWIPADRKYTAVRSIEVQITLEQLARPQTAHYLLAEIPLPDGGLYTLEARRRVGYDQNLPADGIVIHRIAPGDEPAIMLMRHAPRSGVWSDSVWAPGMTFADVEYDIRVTVERATATGYVVTISTGAPG